MEEGQASGQAGMRSGRRASVVALGLQVCMEPTTKRWCRENVENTIRKYIKRKQWTCNSPGQSGSNPDWFAGGTPGAHAGPGPGNGVPKWNASRNAGR